MLGTNGIDVVASGVAPSHGNHHYDQKDDISSNKETTKNVKYYQWVVFVLILQVSQIFFISHVKFKKKIYSLKIH